MTQLAVDVAVISVFAIVSLVDEVKLGSFRDGKRGGQSSQSEEYDERVCAARLLIVPTLWSCRIFTA